MIGGKYFVQVVEYLDIVSTTAQNKGERIVESTFAELNVRIELGIRFLNATVGYDWVDRIDLDSFDLCDAYNCVLGQVFDHNNFSGYHSLECVLGEDMMYNMGFISRSQDDWFMDRDHYMECDDETCTKCQYGVIEAGDVMQEMWEHRIREIIRMR